MHIFTSIIKKKCSMKKNVIFVIRNLKVIFERTYIVLENKKRLQILFSFNLHHILF